MWHFLITSVSLFRVEGKGEHLQGMEVSSLTLGLCREGPVSRPIVGGYGLNENDYFQYYSDRQIFLFTTALGSTHRPTSGHWE